MANLEKLIKSWEALKNLPQQLSEDVPSRKKEKLSFCVSVADTFCSSQSSKSGGTNMLLSFAVESLIQMCNDSDSDVRMTADENLNRIIRQAIMESHGMKVQIELHREIKRNGNGRSLRAALWRFAYLCHLIRPQKGKPFVNNLIPCLIQICKRTEEPLQETLSNAMPRIFKALGAFAMDKDVKALLKALISNLSSSSAQIRRTAASCVVSICQYCRKPQVFLTDVLNTLVDMLVPICSEQTVPEILGLFGCLRALIPLLVNLTDQHIDHGEIKGSFGVQRRHEDVSIGIDRIIQVYELSIHFSRHADHNVVNAALELLHQILMSPPPGILPVLLSPHGISRSRIIVSGDQHQSVTSSISEVSMSESTVVSDENTLFEHDSILPNAMSEAVSTPLFSKLVQGGISDISTDEESKDTASVTMGSGTLQLLDAADPLEPALFSVSECELSVDSISSQASAISLKENIRKTQEFVTISSNSAVSVEHCSPPLSAGGMSVCSPPPGPNQPDVKFQVCDIGSLTDGSIPLVYCARHLATSFLLTGHAGYRMPDRCVRVSVKALALNCIASIVRLHPNVFQLYLDKDPVSPSRRPTDSRSYSQPLCDVLQYSEHTDPQLRAICCILVASLIRSVLVQSGGNWESWQRKADSKVACCLELSHLIRYLIKGLEDESSTTCRQTLVALMQCFSELLVSRDSFEALPVFQALSSLSLNPYWLVKVKLVELISELPFVIVQFVCGSSAFQEKVINEILLKLLEDEDSRVRKATAEAIVRIVPNLCFLTDYTDANVVNTMACYLSESQLSSLFEDSDYSSLPSCASRKFQSRTRQLEILTPPFNAWNTMRCSQKMQYLEASLSRIIYSLSHLLLQSSSKYLTLGCCESLSLLASKYPATVYMKAWDCLCNAITSQNNFGKCESKIDNSTLQCSPASGLLHTVLSLLVSSSVTLDLGTMQWLTLLAGNLFCGLAVANMCPQVNISSAKVADHPQQHPGQLWSMFQDKQLVVAAESILLHVMRTLNIILHILEDSNPSTSTSKPGLPSLSPIKRHASSVGKHASSSGDMPSEGKSGRGLSPIRNIIHGEKEDKADDKKGGKNSPFGSFANNQHYVKVFELLRSSYANYKMSLETEVCEKFTGIVNSTLEVLSQLLEVMTVVEAGRLAEELLSYLRSTMSLAPVSTVHCVNQLLKCVVGMNLISFWNEKAPGKDAGGYEPSSGSTAKGHGFYYHCFSQPFHYLGQFVAAAASKSTNVEVTHAAEWMSSMHQRSDAKPVFTLGRTADTSFLASYIRLFEPVVIESLQQYTVTSDVQLQVKVLLLLTQLVQLRVNYCLLDSEMVFIGFVHKQFEFIEEGQILNAEALITCIFHFMVLLSFEKHHSKSITTIPKVIQLCDGLMASGQNPLTHCIPALLPVVQHGFLSKGSAGAVIDAEELETQREVMVAMLLRLVEYHQVMELLNLVLVECRGWHDGEERWKRWSRQVTDVVLGLLASGRLRLDSLPAQQALHHLFLHSVAPSVLWPVDPLLRVLFAQPPQVESSTQSVIRWLGTVLSILLVLVAQGKEDATLARIEELNISLSTPFFRVSAVDLGSPDPLNVTAISSKHHSSASPQLTFARLVLCTIGLVGEKIDSVVMDPTSSLEILKECLYLQELLAHFLLVCIHMFQSGGHYKITRAAVELVAGHSTEDSVLLEDANAVFFELAPACPLLMFLWCYLLTLLNYNNHAFWKRVLHPSSQSSSKEDDSEYSHASHSITMEVVRTGAAIVYCDFVCENTSETEQLNWLLKTQIMHIIELSTEPPVQELISVLHRNPECSKGILQTFHDSRILDTKATTIIRLLRFLEGMHPSHSGTLLLLLAKRFVGLPHPALARRAAQLCTRQAEYLLTLSPPQAAQLLSREQLRDVLHSLHHSHLNRKHSGLVSILNKLGSQCLALSPLETDEARPVTPSSIQSLQLDKNWYLSQVKVRCSQASCTAVAVEESALLLGRLDVEDAVSVLSSPDTHLSILQLCFRHGTHQTIQAQTDNSSSHFEDSLSPLYRAARMVLMQHVHHFIELMPKEHQVFLPVDRHMSEAEITYSGKFHEVLSNVVQLESLFRIAAAVSSYLQSLQKLSGTVPSEAAQDLAAFALLCLEAVHCLVSEQSSVLGHYMENGFKSKRRTQVSDGCGSSEDNKTEVLSKSSSNISLKNVKSPQPYYLKLGLDCASQVMNEPCLGINFERPEHASWLASACSSVCAVLYFALQGEALPSVPLNGLSNALSHPESLSIAHACHQMSTLVTYLEKLSHGLCCHNIPDFIFSPIQKLIVRFSRAPLLNSYVWTPPEVWRHGWDVTLGGSCFTHVPLLPTEFLQDMEVLRQFIFRVMLLGWTSRQQFEETWMSLLSVLSAESVVEDMPAEELIVTVQANVLVVKAITALLMQTILLPVPGDPNTGQYMHIARGKKIDYTSSRLLSKLFAVQQLLLWKQESLHGMKSQSVFERPNLEHDIFLNRFGYNQMPIQYLKYALEGSHSEGISEDFPNSAVITLFEKQRNALETSGLDLNSCLYFLLDLFTQWVQPQVAGVIGLHSRLLHEVLCSALAVSDLFTEQSQWLWLLQMSLDLSRHQPPEDHISQQYIILAQCKACAVLQPEAEVRERVRRMLEVALKSSFIPTVAAALHGLLYLLEGSVLATSFQKLEEVVSDPVTAPSNPATSLSVVEDTFGVVNIAVDYVVKNLSMSGSICSNEEVCLLTWTVALFLLDNVNVWKADAVEQAVPLILQQATSMGHSNSHSSPHIQKAVMQGLERLVVSQSGALSRQAQEQITKFVVETITEPNPSLLLHSLQLLLSCMYMGWSENVAAGRDNDGSDVMDPEQLVQAMEKTSALFDRIKKGYPQEVQLICSVLPHLLTDFFPASEVLTKVIGEFLSPQQPHPRLLSGVVFQVFECAVAQSQLSLLQEWFVLSLSNFTQTLPVPMATWCLTCFFISASCNPWLRALFPHVQSRIGRCEFEDRKLLCLSAADFYRQLSSACQTSKFLSTFQAAAERQPSSPFAELIASLN